MSLNYDLRNIADESQDFIWRDGDPEIMGESADKKYMTGEAQTIIFGTMATGMGKITEQNYGKWYYRYRLFSQSIDGSDECYLTLDMVRKMIGLSTNVFPEETDHKFHKACMERFARHQRGKVAAEAKALIEAGTIENKPTV